MLLHDNEPRGSHRAVEANPGTARELARATRSRRGRQICRAPLSVAPPIPAHLRATEQGQRLLTARLSPATRSRGAWASTATFALGSLRNRRYRSSSDTKSDGHHSRIACVNSEVAGLPSGMIRPASGASVPSKGSRISLVVFSPTYLSLQQATDPLINSVKKQPRYSRKPTQTS